MPVNLYCGFARKSAGVLETLSKGGSLISRHTFHPAGRVDQEAVWSITNEVA